MSEALFFVISVIKSGLKDRTEPASENLVLRQLAILNRKRATPATAAKRSVFLGMHFQNMAEMARMPHRGQARDGRPMASKAICPALDRGSGNGQRNPGLGSKDGGCQSVLGKPKNSRGDC